MLFLVRLLTAAVLGVITVGLVVVALVALAMDDSKAAWSAAALIGIAYGLAAVLWLSWRLSASAAKWAWRRGRAGVDFKRAD